MSVCLVASAAAAQTQTQGGEGFALNSFDPAERGSDWFALESVSRPTPSRFTVGAVFDYAYKPLVLYDPEGNERAALVDHQVYVHPGLTVQLFERLRLAVSLPILLVNTGEDVPANTVDAPFDGGAAVGDLRLGVDARVAGAVDGAARLGLGVQVHVPTGSQDAYSGDGSVRVVPRVLLAGDIGMFTYAARVNFQYRNNDADFNGAERGNEVGFGAAAGIRLIDKKLLLGPEIFGSTVVSDRGDGFFAERSTPFELIFGGHYMAESGVHIGVGVGPGLTRGLGAPAVRTLGVIEYTPPVDEPPPPPLPPSDRDGDGITDDKDACPLAPGVANDDPTKHGCPEPADRDEDGIIDDEDACPDEPGVKNEDPKKNGCPEPGDRDGDGIIDDEDACPLEAGEENEDPKKHGCPPPKDTDGDGILDPDDACPKEPGLENEDPKKHGCPKASVVGEKIVIRERVEFDTAKATIRPESDEILTAVLDILKAHPDIKTVSIEGHTDSTGSRAFNTELSKRRARSVVLWLTKHGIDKGRLVSTGHGPDQPIADNDTPEGRQANRRVEFNITSRDKPAE